MAGPVRGGPRPPPLLSLVWLLVCVNTLEVVDVLAPSLTCSQGLTDCRMGSVFTAFSEPESNLNIIHTELSVILCCQDRRDCKPCLQITITISEVDDQDQEVFGESGSGEQSGSSLQQFTPPKTTGLMKVGISSAGSFEKYWELQFTLQNPLQGRQHTHQLRLTVAVTCGSPAVVMVFTNSMKTYNITFPSLEEVCSLDLVGIMTECDAPSVQAVTDHSLNTIILQLNNAQANQEALMCQMFWNEMPGKVVEWPIGQRDMMISMDSVAPCLCFQVWWKGKSLRKKYCPFKEQQDVIERMRHNVSVWMEELQEREGGRLLSWSVTAPCRLEAEVWLCKMQDAAGQCQEVQGSRQRLHNQAHLSWKAPHKRHWTGEFNMSSHPLLCVQVKVHGMISHLEPQCPFTISRWRWGLSLVIGLLLVCFAVVTAYFVQGILKGHVWRWLKEDDVKGAVGGGHVILLYQPDGDEVLPRLLCRLGTSLQALGFSVSLDLWSQSELGVLGPVPWLHSRLDQLKKQGGKVVLVLTKAAWMKAQEWGNQSTERYYSLEKNKDRRPGGAEKSCYGSPTCADVFSASLSCILADYIQGRAGERFMLVQFESLPPEPPDGCRALPELFRGLRVFSLPSQSLGFLTELTGARQMATRSDRRMRAGGIRIASRKLARGLSGFTTGSTMLRLAGMPKDCVCRGEEDSWENVPLQPCLSTPPSSPDTSTKDIMWV